MGNGMDKVLPNLYLGSFRDARDQEQLKKNSITHILSIHETAVPLMNDITYLCIPAADMPSQDLKQYFKDCIAFIHKGRFEGTGCLVHCLAGVSRSATVVVAYVMTVTGLGWEEALAATRVARPCSNPNVGFLHQLDEFQCHTVSEYRTWLQDIYTYKEFDDTEEIRSLLDRKNSDMDEAPKVTGLRK